MEIYDDKMLVRDALRQLFTRFGIPPDAYTAKYFSIQVGKIPVKVPNTPARVRIARYHDIHHIITGYPANWRGEAEIGAWELATGCRRSFVAWFLNGGAIFVGLFTCPAAVIRAFHRGWKTRTNLYHDFDYERLLDTPVGEVKKQVGLFGS